jgi:hypothetical protein
MVVDFGKIFLKKFPGRGAENVNLQAPHQHQPAAPFRAHSAEPATTLISKLFLIFEDSCYHPMKIKTEGWVWLTSFFRT